MGEQPHTTRWGARYMAGTKRRMFLPTPDELRRRYGDNATAVASIYGSLRPAMYAVFAGMGVILIVVGVVAGSGSGWGVAVAGLTIAAACVTLTMIIVHKAKRIASLRP